MQIERVQGIHEKNLIYRFVEQSCTLFQSFLPIIMFVRYRDIKPGARLVGHWTRA